MDPVEARAEDASPSGVLEIDENGAIQLTAAILDQLGAHPRSVLAVDYSETGALLLSLARPDPDRWREVKALRKAWASTKTGMKA